jgi:hypothetical protein
MKSWTTDIEQHIKTWSARLGNLGWWPRYVYHFTDVNNAASIIQNGHLYSRTKAQQQGLMLVDNASPAVIQQTRKDYWEYVRLYFRPRTPTQYDNEGIRPVNQRKLSAHCPVPVFFCFDALTVLTLDSTEFSDGNMGSSRASHDSTRDFFLSIPFHLVFHNRWFSPEERDEIIFRRNAEVLVPNNLPLAPTLKLIACRSAAERQTLLHLLSADQRRRWAPRIRLGEQGLFERKWTYVEEVITVNNDSVIFRFNPNTQTPGPFRISFAYSERGEGFKRTWQAEQQIAKGSLRIRVPGAVWGEATLHLDDALAFADTLIFEEIPF